MTACISWLQPVAMMRMAVLDDRIVDDELHIMRFMPLAWLHTDRMAKFENMPTDFGPVTLRTKLAQGGKELRVEFVPDFREKPKRIVLNGKALTWDGKMDRISVK